MNEGIQVALSVGVPTVAVLSGILISNSRLSDMRSHMDARFDLLQRYIDAWFGEANAQLLRVEGVLDARLKHVVERER